MLLCLKNYLPFPSFTLAHWRISYCWHPVLHCYWNNFGGRFNFCKRPFNVSFMAYQPVLFCPFYGKTIKFSWRNILISVLLWELALTLVLGSFSCIFLSIFFQESVMSVLDHKNIDKDVPYFKDVVRYAACIQFYLIDYEMDGEWEGNLFIGS